jgi:CMP-N-acetylneuraminic acid synthetase
MKFGNNIACFIPIKENSQRVKGKNLRHLGNKPLYRHILDRCTETFNNVFVDTDSETIKNFCYKNNINVIDRIPKLLKDSANGNDLLEYWIQQNPEFDYYFQIHVTAPFTSISTIKNCVNTLVNKDYDSVFTAYEDKTWYWFDNKPVNYDPKNFPRSQDARGLIKETTCLYGIEKNQFMRERARIGDNPFVYLVDYQESLDIDNEHDFEYCNFLINK